MLEKNRSSWLVRISAHLSLSWSHCIIWLLDWWESLSFNLFKAYYEQMMKLTVLRWDQESEFSHSSLASLMIPFWYCNFFFLAGWEVGHARIQAGTFIFYDSTLEPHESLVSLKSQIVIMVSLIETKQWFFSVLFLFLVWQDVTNVCMLHLYNYFGGKSTKLPEMVFDFFYVVQIYIIVWLFLSLTC